MAIATARALTKSGTYLVDRAKRLARKLLRLGKRSAVETIDGYLLRASAVGDIATGLVIDPPGALVVFQALLDPRGNTYPIGPRDFFDSRTQDANGPFGYEQIEPKNYVVYFYGIGFDPEEEAPDTPWKRASLWRVASPTKRERLRANMLRIVADPAVPFPYDTVDLAPPDTLVFSGVDTFPKSRRVPGYHFFEPGIAELAPGFQLMARTELGYMAFEYQGMQPASASSGDWTLMVIPVVKNFDPSQAVHWGQPGVLFVLLNAALAIEEEKPTPVRWSRLWSPDEHSIDFFHSGPWEARPRNTITSPFADPQQNWDDFWNAWSAGGQPIPAGGTRPNWTDAIGVAWFNGRFVVNLRCCALNATLSDFGVGWDYEYVDAGGSAHLRFEVTLDGSFSVAEQQHEVWDCADATNPGRRRPYDIWVAGQLDEAVVHAVNPAGTFPIPGGLCEVAWCMEADRAGAFGPVFGPYFYADLSSARLEFTVRLLDADGNEQPPATHVVYFEDLGAGIQGPTTTGVGVGADLVLLPPTGSYKLWPMAPLFVAVSQHEIGFAVCERWQDFGPGDLGTVKLAVLDLLTGAASIRSDIGLENAPLPQQERPVHLDCLQRAIYNDEGETVLEAVLFASVDSEQAVRISRDSGRTWSDYLTFPQPLAGAYYLANPLMPGDRVGTAILEDKNGNRG